MIIPLNEFEQHIDVDILKRGLQYFKKGHVTSVDELSGGEYEAIVEGSETYTVHLQLKNGSIIGNYCTCPYDWGPFCKHEVAVLFYLQQDELGLKVKKNSSVKSSPSAKAKTEKKAVNKKKTIQDQLTEILEKLSPDEIKSYIGECCDKDKAFRNLFLTRYLHLIQPVSQDLYARQIRAIIKSALGRHGYIDYAGARKVGHEVNQLYQLAERSIAAGNYREAMFMGCAMLEEMTKAIEQGDDSNGDLGGCIEEAQEVLFRVAGECTDLSVRRELFDYAITAYQKQLFEGWDWHYHMLDLAIELIETEKDKNLIMKLINQVTPTGESWDYRYDQAQKMKLELIRKTEGEDQVNKYLETNINNSDFRRELILKAIREKHYPKAIALAEDGIAADRKEKPGLADEWKWHLLNIYQLQRDTPNIITQARYLFLNSSRFSSREMFEILKKHVQANEWKHFFELLVSDRKKSEKWVYFNSIADMYIWENQEDNLLNWLISNQSLNNIVYVEKYLAKQFSEQLVDMYYKIIENYLKVNISRDHYQTACKYMRRMNKLGGSKKTEILVTELRNKYPQRRALMEELEKI